VLDKTIRKHLSAFLKMSLKPIVTLQLKWRFLRETSKATEVPLKLPRSGPTET
jgi:hypothetical protein